MRSDRPAPVMWLLLLGLMLGLGMGPAKASKGDAQALVDRAEQTLQGFRADPDMAWFRKHLPQARGLMIVPQLVKAGFIFGGSGGSGVLLGRTDGGWSMPAFYDMGSVSFGLQIGGEVAEVMLLIMTQRGMDAMYSTEFKLGADASVAVGPTGVGAQAATADVLAFSRSKGAFAGLTLEGAILAPKDDWNSAYYGRGVRPIEIVREHAVSNPGANGLIGALKGR
ncbi:MAG: lipid-binding SYLF domain-containing protein [Gammaproteobacteria bacterium]|nr:lipid-binding SYLF domain-containing protein [Gammaproteobacteria bacterium]